MTTVGTIVSARSASRRLPRKALLDLGGVPMIQFLLERLRGSRLGGQLVFATTEREDDDELARRVAAVGVPVYRGADADVVERYLGAARAFGLDWVVRVTGDCPFVDADTLDRCLEQWGPTNAMDIVSTKGVFPVGIDYELFSVATMAREWAAMSEAEKEHLTLRLYRTELGFSVGRFARPQSWPAVGAVFTVDTQDDYERATRWARRIGNRTFPVEELLRLSVSEGV